MPSQTQVWNSDDDEGDELFHGHETVATLPLESSRASGQKSSTQTEYITQPTQPLPRSSPAPGIQVLASSPSQNDRSAAEPSAAPMARGSLNRGFASTMAPPGTQFRNPTLGWQAKESQPPIADLTQSSQINVDTDSSEDELVPNNIRPTSFEKGPSAQRVEESPRSGFASFASSFAYGGSGQKRPSDAMADAYSSSRRPKAARTQDSAHKAPAWSSRIETVDDIPNLSLIDKATRIHNTLPQYTAKQIYTALQKNKGDEGGAMTWLADEDDRQGERAKAVDLSGSDEDHAVPKQARPSAKRSIQGPVRSINEKWSQGQRAAPAADSSFIQSLMNRGQEPVKRQVKDSKSISEKWSNTKRADAQPRAQPPATADEAEKKPRKRLIQGRKNPVDSSPLRDAPTARESRPPSPAPANTQPMKKTVHVIEDDDEDEADSGVGSSDEDVRRDELLDAKILSFINSCTREDLVEVSGQPMTNTGPVLDRRPFETMDELRAVVHETQSTTKTGKTRTMKHPVGQRLCDVLEEIFQGYEAVDELVRKCEELGKPLAAEMKQWGFNAFGTSQQGELEMVDLTAAHDSGIGTPSSSTGSNVDEPDDGPLVKNTRRKLLQQPTVMSSDLVMKDYQVAGLNWLALLFSKKLSCILADDMGLGKTCQVISFLAHLFETGISMGPHLIIVPGSTLENWLREFRNFCPKLRVEPYYGKQAERAEMQLRLRDELDQIQVVVTTYDMASKHDDASFLKKLRPVVCVYDEGHALKNSQSMRYRELMRIPAKFRLLLTGTPLQNNLQELISLLAFIMPNLFSEKQEALSYIFKHRAKTTDAEHTALLNAERISKARSMMTPFILRRKKHQVLKDIPKKTSNVVHCELPKDQRALYDEQRAAARSALLGGGTSSEPSKKKRGAKTSNTPAKLSNNIMMDLRKAAIHPLLFRRLYTDKILKDLAKAFCRLHPECSFDLVLEDLSVMTDFELNRWCKNDDNSATPSIYKHRLKGTPWMNSGKVTELVRLLKQFAKNGDRTLVFSQFTLVMDVLELVFETAGIGFYRLDGGTLMQTRQDLLDQFYADDTPVFMLSTKAGGAGINLACANKVIIFDMSYNPQDDVQAENRAHRVGQKREVEVIRLVSRNTVEEQILRLGESKLALDAQVAGEGGSSKSGDESEKNGLALVEAMVKDELLGQDADKSEEPREVTVQSPKAEEGLDLKAEYMEGLKAAGLDMSAAAE